MLLVEFITLLLSDIFRQTKKVGNQTLTLTTEQQGKQPGKSIVKVITSQGATQSGNGISKWKLPLWCDKLAVYKFNVLIDTNFLDF